VVKVVRYPEDNPVGRARNRTMQFVVFAKKINFW
jgi:hypothetical protein